MKNDPRTINARSAAFLALKQVEKEDAYANIALKKVLNQYKLPSQDSRLAAQITYGTTRMRLALDHIMAQFLKRPVRELMPELKIILRLSLYQLHYLDIEPYAAVNEGVALTKKYASPKLSGLANGVMRNYLRADKEKLLPRREDGFRDYLHITLSFPLWLVDHLLARYTPEEAEAFCLHANAHRGIVIRTNTLKNSPEKLAQLMAEEGITVERAGYAPGTLRFAGETGNLAAQHLFQEGCFTVQGLSSQLVAYALSPRKGDKVLDLCAAPGGKTTHLAELMENEGDIRAFDVHPHKVALIEANAKRLGIDMIKAETADSRALPQDYHEWADCVLLDAPCSGLGTLSARADSRYRKEHRAIDQLAGLSSELLDAAAGYLRKGGKLCYSTCTITDEENGANVRRFLEKHPEFSQVPLAGLMELMPEAKEQLTKGEIQLLPFSDEQEMDGFYIALLEKKQ